MKKTIISILLFGLFSCNQEPTFKIKTYETNIKSRIKVSERLCEDGRCYYIIKVDSVEFIVVGNDAIHKL